MAAISSLLFCLTCGNLLDTSSSLKKPTINCPVCGTQNPDTSSKTVITRSKPTAFPSSLRSKRSEVQTLSAEDMNTQALTAETCEKCGREEVRFYTQQLRSADEGSTVFFSCECGHKWTQNN